jgi:exopolyphosphatase/guanosine-5'-triphosphate,3'-diphosphate pyrophosphatase
MSGISNVEGLAMDFGGGSLELIEISDKTIKKTTSIPFGTNVTNDSISIEKVFEHISNNFQEKIFSNLYLIGGTFRLIGRNYMYIMKHPLRILHNIVIPICDFYNYINIVEKDENLNLNDSQKNAVKIIQSIVNLTNTKNIIISNYGLKEGVRFQYLLDENENKKNLVYERSKIVTNFNEISCNIEAYFKILKNLDIPEDSNIEEILALSLMFARFYFKSGNSMGGSFVYDFIMTSDIPFSEKQRIMIMASLSFVFLNNIPHNIKKLCNIYLSNKEYAIVNIIGNFIKIISEIDGVVMCEPNFNLVLNSRFIEIQTDYTLPSIIYHKVKMNLKEISFFIKKI